MTAPTLTDERIDDLWEVSRWAAGPWTAVAHHFARAIEAEIRAADGSNSVAADAKPALTLCSNEADGGARCDDQCAECAWASGQPTWDASQVKQPGWQHVEGAFIEGAREARANPEADEAMFRRAADGYTKRVFEEVDPVSEAALRTESWSTQVAADAGPAGKAQFPYDRTFNAIAAATRSTRPGVGIGISVKDFIAAWNKHPTPPLPAASEPASGAVQVLREALEGLMELERRGRFMPIGREWDKARAALASTAGATVMEAGSEPNLMQRVIAHLEAQATYTPSERNREALRQLLAELRAAVMEDKKS